MKEVTSISGIFIPAIRRIWSEDYAEPIHFELREISNNANIVQVMNYSLEVL
jgi:hypothetical protein